MRYIDRNAVAPPASLSGPSAAVALERQRAHDHFTADDPAPAGPFTFVHYKGYDVCQALSALFHDKCAYCEGEIGNVGAREVEHFRPKGKVEGEAGHPGYWWLALEWENLLPSCPACNKRRYQHIIDAAMTTEQVASLLAAPPRKSWGKGMQFPIAGTRALTPECGLEEEDPLVIDPTSRDPRTHLVWYAEGDFSVVLPAIVENRECQYGRETVNVFALNRVQLVQSRTRVLNELRFHRTKVIEELNRIAEFGDPDGARLETVVERIETMKRLAQPAMPYSAMAEAFIENLTSEVGLAA